MPRCGARRGGWCRLSFGAEDRFGRHGWRPYEGQPNRVPCRVGAAACRPSFVRRTAWAPFLVPLRGRS